MYPSERGNILITVLWIIAVMAVLVLGLNYEARSDIERTRLMRDRSSAYWLARAGVEMAKYDFALSRMRMDEEFQAKSVYEYQFETGYALCQMVSESGKMSVNSTNRQLWMQALSIFGLSEQQVDEIVDAILDWRDPDDEKHLNGCESEYYQSLNPPYYARNGPFTSVDEIMLVRGVSQGMFYGTRIEGQDVPGLNDILSVSNPSIGRFDINSCPKEILIAFLGITTEEAEAIIQARQEQLFQGVDDAARYVGGEAAENLSKFFTAYRGNQFTVKSTGFVYNSPARYTVEDEVRYVGGGQLFVTMSHKDFSMKHVDKIQQEEDEAP